MPPAVFSALVADPSLYGLQVVRGVLVRMGVHRIAEVLDGAEALGAMSERRPDFVVVDWDLPVLPAREVIACARDTTSAPAIPILVTMAAPTRSAVKSAIGMGVGAVLATPFAPRELRARIETLVASPPPGV